MVPPKRLKIAWYHFIVPSALCHFALLYVVAPMLHVRQDFIALHAIAPVRPAVTIALIPSDPAPAAPAATPDDDPFEASHDDDLRRELLDPTDNIPRAPHIPLPTPNAPTEPSNAPTEAANTPTEAANTPTEAANPPTEATSAPTEAANPPIEPVLAQTAQTAPTGSPSIHNNGHRTAPQTATRPQTGTGSHAGTAHGTATAPNEAAIWNAYARQLSAHFKRFKKYPPMAQRLKLTGTAWVRIELQRDGTILDAQIDASSGHDILDKAALQAARSAQPLPPFPPQIAAKTRKIRIPYQFSLRD